jgi:hypothetical protein
MINKAVGKDLTKPTTVDKQMRPVQLKRKHSFMLFYLSPLELIITGTVQTSSSGSNSLFECTPKVSRQATSHKKSPSMRLCGN